MMMAMESVVKMNLIICSWENEYFTGCTRLIESSCLLPSLIQLIFSEKYHRRKV